MGTNDRMVGGKFQLEISWSQMLQNVASVFGGAAAGDESDNWR